jgi:hypothetical protein
MPRHARVNPTTRIARKWVAGAGGNRYSGGHVSFRPAVPNSAIARLPHRSCVGLFPIGCGHGDADCPAGTRRVRLWAARRRLPPRHRPGRPLRFARPRSAWWQGGVCRLVFRLREHDRHPEPGWKGDTLCPPGNDRQDCSPRRDGNQGTILGAVGTMGHAHGAHLHFEVRIRNEPVDPSRYLALAAPAHEAEPEHEEVAEAPAPRRAVRAGARPDQHGPERRR